MSLNATIFAQMLILVLVIWVTKKWLWPQIIDPIERRQKMIADGLAAADRATRDLAAAESRVNELVSEARVRAQQIENNAQRQAADIIETAKQTAGSEGARLLAAAQQQIVLDTQKARDELRGQVAALAVAGAGKLIEKEIDPRTHAQLLDKLVAQI